MWSLGKTLLDCFILYSKAKLACYSRYFLTSYFCIPILHDEKDIFFGVSSRKSRRSSLNHSNSVYSALLVGIEWDYCDIEWFAWKWIEIILLSLRLHPCTTFQTLVYYEGYSLSSKGFLPTVVDIMII